jgi:hypothetical protein
MTTEVLMEIIKHCPAMAVEVSSFFVHDDIMDP